LRLAGGEAIGMSIKARKSLLSEKHGGREPLRR
jgi:hypothetical protein